MSLSTAGSENNALFDDADAVFAASINRLDTVLETISDGYLCVDNDWKILYWNRAAEEMTGVPRATIVGKNLLDHLKEINSTEFLSIIEASKKQDRQIETEVTHPSNHICFSIKTRPVKDGLAIYFNIVSNNNKPAPQADKSTTYETLLNASKDAIWSINTNLELLAANEAYRQKVLQATGLHIKVGDNVLNGYPESFQRSQEELYRRCLAGESFVEHEPQLQANDAVNYCEISYNPIYDANGAITAVACFSRNITERRQHQVEKDYANALEREQKLQQFSSDLETVLNPSLDLICSVDDEGKFVHLNATFEDLLGYKLSDLKGKYYLNIVHPNDVAETLALSKEVKNGGRVTSFRNRVLTASGTEITILWSTHFDQNNKISFSVGRDASTLVQAEMIKERSERRLGALLEKGRDMVWLIDKEANLIFVSPNIKNILGYETKELLHKNSFELIHPDDIAIAAKTLATLNTEKEIGSVTIRCKNKDGEWRWIELVATNLMDDPAVGGLVVNSRDVTSRKLQEEELRNANTRFQTVLNVTRDVIWEWDLATDKVYKNSNHEALFGYIENGNETGKSWVERIHEGDRQRVKDSIIEKIQTGDDRPWQQEYRYYRANGEIAYVIDRGILIIDKHGSARRMVGSLVDITERKKIENERELIIEELTNTNNDLKQFSFITSHNLRAPLSNVIGLLGLVDHEQLNDTNRQMFQLLQLSVGQLRNTIQDLTDIIVIRDRTNCDLDRVNIEATFEEVKRVYLNTLHDIPFKLHTNFAIKEVALNKSYLSSIFINLLSNAVKYRAEQKALQIYVDATLENNWCIIKFSDNGVGLDLSRIENRLFGLYQRFHENTEGKGLGLFIVKSQVTAMGGTIGVESKINEGATFTIKLPLNKQTCAEPLPE